MVLGQDYKEGAVKHLQKIPIIFGEGSKMYDVERCHAGTLRHFYWPTLDAFGLHSLVGAQVARSV